MLVFTDERMTEHDPGDGHPDQPRRWRAAMAGFEGETIEQRAPQPAPVEAIARVHEAAHIDLVERARGKRGQFDADTHVSEGSVEAAYLAVGAALDATEAVLREDGPDCAWAVVRPPGHHAERMVPMGFCLFNNIAVAAAQAAAKGRRVLIVDFDVHHGNGTQHAFDDSDEVLFVSLHQYPFYPGTGSPEEIGRGAGLGHTVNFAVPAGSTDGDYLAAFDDVLLPIASTFSPDLVMVSAGFDGHRDDPLGDVRLSEAGFANMVARLHAMGQPLVLTLEGGYELDALSRSVASCTAVLSGDDPSPLSSSTTERGGAAIAATRRVHAQRWGLHRKYGL